MGHYVCSECGNVSRNAGNCQADFCARQGLKLSVCNCEDEKHEGVIANNKPTSVDEENSPGSGINTIDLDSSNNA